MTLQEAYKILDIDCFASASMVKQNYRWLIKLYHPDCGKFKDHSTTLEIIKAYKLVISYWG